MRKDWLYQRKNREGWRVGWTINTRRVAKMTGSVIALSDEDGDTVETYEYSVYGRVQSSGNGHANPYLFTGRRLDTETGLYYYRARYYNAEIGRFLQTDPVGYGDGMSWYAYCGNNPANMMDPSGLTAYLICGIEWNHTSRGFSRMHHSGVAVETSNGLLYTELSKGLGPPSSAYHRSLGQVIAQNSIGHSPVVVAFDDVDADAMEEHILKRSGSGKDDSGWCSTYAAAVLEAGGVRGLNAWTPLTLAESAVTRAERETPVWVENWSEWGKFYFDVGAYGVPWAVKMLIKMTPFGKYYQKPKRSSDILDILMFPLRNPRDSFEEKGGDLLYNNLTDEYMSGYEYKGDGIFYDNATSKYVSWIQIAVEH